jgi:hypothetical protein
MKTKFKVYTYVTPDHEPGCMIVHPDLCAPFDKQMLLEMDKLVMTELSLRDILEKGFIKLGAPDMMEDMDIEYPLIENDKYVKNRITGKHWEHSLEDIAIEIGKDFEIVDVRASINSDSSSESGDLIDSRFIDLDDDLKQVEVKELDSILEDGKLDDIFEKIKDAEDTVVKEADRLLSEL